MPGDLEGLEADKPARSRLWRATSLLDLRGGKGAWRGIRPGTSRAALRPLALHGPSFSSEMATAYFHFPLGMEKFMSPKFELDWLPPTVDLGSERPVDQLTSFACFNYFSGTWFRVPETRLLASVHSF